MNLYNTVMRQPLIDNFDAIMEKYIFYVTNDSGFGVETNHDENNYIAKGKYTIEIDDGENCFTPLLNCTCDYLIAWAYIKDIITAPETLSLLANCGFDEVDKEDQLPIWKNQIIDELLTNNDWEFLK